MRPVDKPANAPNYDSSVQDRKFRRNGAVQTLHGSPLSLDEIADMIDDYDKGTLPKTTDQQKKAYSRLVERRDDGYREAFPDLVTAIDRYCSYCEIKVNTNMAVEHVVPKAPFPYFSVAWSNFLLACDRCNSIKNNNPGRTAVIGWVNANGNHNPTEGDLRDEIRDRYAWPDRYTNTYRNFRAELCDNTTTAFPNNRAYALNNSLVSSVNNTVTANILNIAGTGVQQQNVKVYIAGQTARSIALQGLVGLNTVNTASDGRMTARTETWFMAIASINDLRDAVRDASWQAAKQRAVRRHMREVARTVKAGGFYSTWLRVFDYYNDPLGNDLGVALRDQLNPATSDAPGYTIVGTDYTSLP